MRDGRWSLGNCCPSWPSKAGNRPRFSRRGTGAKKKGASPQQYGEAARGEPSQSTGHSTAPVGVSQRRIRDCSRSARE